MEEYIGHLGGKCQKEEEKRGNCEKKKEGKKKGRTRKEKGKGKIYRDG